jgi:hypothetical protein
MLGGMISGRRCRWRDCIIKRTGNMLTYDGYHAN